MLHGSEVSTLPQIEQVESLSATCASAREERLERGLALLHQVQHRAPRRARAEARQPRERLATVLRSPGRHDCALLDRASAAPQVRARCASSSWDRRNSRCRASTRWSRPGTRSSRSIPSRRGRRGAARRERKTAVHERAEALGIEVRTPETLRDEEEQARFRALERRSCGGRGLRADPAQADPRSAARLGCINVHASLLPRWRGAAPIQRAILAGDEISGVTHHADGRRARHRADAAASRRSTFAARTAGQVTDEMAKLGARLLVQWLDQSRRRPSRSRSPARPTPRKIDKAEARIDWSQPGRRDRAAGPRLQSLARAPGSRPMASGSSCSRLKSQRDSAHSRE